MSTMKPGDFVRIKGPSQLTVQVEATRGDQAIIKYPFDDGMLKHAIPICELEEIPRHIAYGDVEIPKEDFGPEAMSLRVSVMIPGDVLTRLQKRAEREGVSYKEVILAILQDRA